jgi:hypothetical protein
MSGYLSPIGTATGGTNFGATWALLASDVVDALYGAALQLTLTFSVLKHNGIFRVVHADRDTKERVRSVFIKAAYSESRELLLRK